ncbi:MAG: UDP-N-acetylmuramoyl-L-alanyl-D-glutamate--2,6-diaminopimelate ligase [Ruminococcaceae bacterium]|nr:UDP-N-acetylmuramoyl-L-alanyl-D-glutamate--2,6-diaminopimelate ligase [Oscillospiraceae bacterium]
MKLNKLLKSIGIITDIETEIKDIIFDSRVKNMENCVFVCLKGASFDAHDFAEEAVDKGAVAVVAQRELTINAPCFVVENTRKALALLSACFFDNPSEKLTTIGLTGTKGKTTSAFMLKSIFEAAGKKVGVIGTIGVLIGNELIKTNNTTPENYFVQKYMALMAEKGCDVCVMEVSSIGLKDYRVYGFTFDLGIFTNFSEDHIGGVEHKDMEEYLYCKSLLFKMCKKGIINIDDENYKGIIKDHTCEITTYGFNNEAELIGKNSELYSENGFIGSSLEVEIKNGENFKTLIGMPGKFNAYNALGVIAAALECGVNTESIKEGLKNVNVKGRVERIPTNGNYTLLIDYAHNAVSMRNVLTTLREYKPKRIVTMFGAGGNRPKVRRYEMGEESGKLSDLSVITEDNSRFEEVTDIIEDIKVGINKTSGKYIVIPNRKDAIRYCIENAEEGDIIVLAGKGHEDYQEIKGVKYPFDERDVIKEIYASLEK